MLKLEELQQLNQQNQVKLFSNRTEKYTYLGLLDQYQQLSSSETFKLNYARLNQKQHFLFKRVLHGLNMYSQEEIKNLHWDKLRRIKKVWQRGQLEVNAWKQEISNKRVNDVIKLFDNKTTGKNTTFALNVNNETVNKFSFRDLGIEYEDVILFYISKGLLPKNFLEIKNDNQKSI